MIKVLIVEDDPMVAQLNRRYVESVAGFKVMGIATNGEDALKQIKKMAIDLMILDVYMPKIDGMGVLKEMRRKLNKIDVILVTAAKEVDNIDSSLRLGAVDYLIKPFEYERLKNSLENYSMRYKLMKKKDTIKQEDIDRITKGYGDKKHGNLKKGLHKITLERIRNYMMKNSHRDLTSEEVAENVDLSRVTVKRYLEYLESIGEVQQEIQYGSIGRPSHLFKYKKV